MAPVAAPERRKAIKIGSLTEAEPGNAKILGVAPKDRPQETLKESTPEDNGI